MTEIILGPQPIMDMATQNITRSVDIIAACNAELARNAQIFTLLGAGTVLVGLLAAWLVLRYYPDIPDYFFKP
jgi:CHASE3 domain sensor protein